MIPMHCDRLGSPVGHSEMELGEQNMYGEGPQDPNLEREEGRAGVSGWREAASCTAVRQAQ